MGEVQIASPGPPARAGAERGGRERKSESIEIGAAERTAGTRPPLHVTWARSAVETAPRSRTEEGRHFGKKRVFNDTLRMHSK